MKLFILFIILIYGLVFFQFNKNQFNQNTKMIIFYSLLLFPYVSAYFPRIRITSGILLTGPRFFLLIFFFLFIIFIIKHKSKFKIPEYIKWYIIYLLFSLANRFFHQNGVFSGTYQSNILIDNYILPVCFLILIENLSYEEKDLKRFVDILVIVAIGTFLASFIQTFINPFFYAGNTSIFESDTSWYNMYKVTENLYYNRSIYIGMKANDVGRAIYSLLVIFLFLNFQRYQKKYVIITLLLVFSGIATLSREIWLCIIIVIVCFLHYNYKNKLIIFLGVLAILLFFSYNKFFSTLEDTDIYQKRIVARSYISRINDPTVYFTLFFPQRPFLGYGMSSSENQRFTIFHNIIHNHWLEIMFKDGFVGLFFIFMFIYHIYRRGRMVFKATGNPVFIVFIMIYCTSNIFATYHEVSYYGYYVMFLYLTMNYKLYMKRVQMTQKVF